LASALRCRAANLRQRVMHKTVKKASSTSQVAEGAKPGLNRPVTAALQRPISCYASASRAWPLPVAFATCWVKGCASDLVTQKIVEGKDKLDVRRNLAFATFSGAYLGCGQHVIYNVLFTRLFGAGHDLATALKKVIADGLWHVPMLYLPLYYAFEDTILRGGPMDGMKRYSKEWLDCVKPYWSMWTFFHLFNFSFTPPELRIGLIACVSFVWLIVLSYVSHKSYEAEKSQASH